MKTSKLFFLLLAIALTTTIATTEAHEKGDFGMSAAIAMPNGVTPSTGLTTNTTSRLSISSTAASSFNIMLTNTLQLDLGLGYLSIDNGVEGSDPANTLSFMAGGKYFFNVSDVSPYVNLGLSYTQIPTIETVGNGFSTEVSGSMMTVLAAFGAQAFLNSTHNIAIFVQMGIGYNMGTVDTKSTVNGTSTTNSNEMTNLNLGGSAVGLTVYF